MPEHQKVQKRLQKIQSIQDKRRNMQKENAAAQEEMRKIREENDRKEERFRQNKMADAEMAADLQSLQAGEKRRGSNAPKTGDCCLEEMLQSVIALGTNGVEVLFQTVRREMGVAEGQISGREEGRRNSEDEQEQGRISQQLLLPAPAGINEGTPASSLELDLPRVRGALGESGGAGKSGTQGDLKRALSNFPSRRPMEEDAIEGDL